MHKRPLPRRFEIWRNHSVTNNSSTWLGAWLKNLVFYGGSARVVDAKVSGRWPPVRQKIEPH